MQQQRLYFCVLLVSLVWILPNFARAGSDHFPEIIQNVGNTGRIRLSMDNFAHFVDAEKDPFQGTSTPAAAKNQKNSY